MAKEMQRAWKIHNLKSFSTDAMNTLVLGWPRRILSLASSQRPRPRDRVLLVCMIFTASRGLSGICLRIVVCFVFAVRHHTTLPSMMRALKSVAFKTKRIKIGHPWGIDLRTTGR
jgi:hypothetical protein